MHAERLSQVAGSQERAIRRAIGAYVPFVRFTDLVLGATCCTRHW